MSTTQEITEQVKQASAWIKPLQDEIARVVVGQKYLVDGLLTGLLTNGHILLEGVPGLAKTLTVKTLASCIHTGFQRIQFTPDLLPADLIGTLIYNPRSGEFTTKRGPLFSNLILADEINRAPAKVQSALLEAMQERQVTIGDTTYPLADPFLVLATQNPLEQEGTYQLPEAQLDRFTLKLRVGYPTKAEERKILDLMATSAPNLNVVAVTEPADILHSREIVNSIYVDDRVKDYIVDVVFATRDPASYKLKLDGMIRYGASPRASEHHLCGRPGEGLHRRCRLRHARSGKLQAEARRNAPLRRIPPRDDRTHTRRQGQSFPLRPRLRDSAGCEKRRLRRAAPPHHRELRSGGRGGDERADHRDDFRGAAGAVRANVNGDW